MIAKFLILIIVLFTVYIIFFKPSKKGKNTKQNISDNFVQCHKCETFININESILSNGKYICNDCLKEK